MATETVSVAKVDQAEAKLLDTKERAHAKSATAADRRAYQRAAQRLSELRRSWREQEEAAGRRGLVGGDATREG